MALDIVYGVLVDWPAKYLRKDTAVDGATLALPGMVVSLESEYLNIVVVLEKRKASDVLVNITRKRT